MKKLLTLVIASSMLVGMGNLSAQNCYNCGTGADGVYNAVASDTLHSGTYNFTSFTIGANDTIKVKGSAKLIIHCTGKVVINGILDASGGNGTNGVTFSKGGLAGKGVAGGSDGGDGVFSAVNGPLGGVNGNGIGFGDSGSGWSGGGGAGFAAAGRSSGGVGGFGGIAYGLAKLIPTLGGSGGGGGSGGNNCGSGGGGAGGGVIFISACDSIIIGVKGQIKSNGGHGGSDGTGNCGGGGGGSGGSLWLAAKVIDNNGTVQADSGIGGASNIPNTPYYGTGANGAEGRIRTDANSIIGSGTISPAAGYSAIPLKTNISAIDLLCHGDSNGMASVSTSGGQGAYTYSWAPVGGTNNIANNLKAGTYTCTITDSTGCSITASVAVTQPPALSVIIDSMIAPSCFSKLWAVVSGGTKPYHYLWNNGATTDSIKNLCPGSYTVTVIDSNGCKTSVSLKIVVNSVAEVGTKHNIHVYPVPATNILNVEIDGGFTGTADLSVFDLAGRTILEQEIVPRSNRLLLDISKLESGIYFLKISGAGNELVKFEVFK